MDDEQQAKRDAAKQAWHDQWVEETERDRTRMDALCLLADLDFLARKAALDASVEFWRADAAAARLDMERRAQRVAAAGRSH